MEIRLAGASFAAVMLFSVFAHAAPVAEKTCNSISERMSFLDKNASFTVNVFPQNEPSLGSGVVFKDKEGLGIITNNHVISNSPYAAYVVFFGTENAVKVNIIGRDPSLDIALLSVPDRLPLSVTLFDLNKQPLDVSIGDEVYAVGYARGTWMPSVGWMNSKSSAGSPIFFTHQAPLQPGNSGGPLLRFTEKCVTEVVGINTMMGTVGLLSFSVPMKYVKKMLPRLRTEKIVEHAYTGLRMFDVKKLPPPLFEQKAQREYRGESGIFVFSVAPDSPGDKAGVKAGDLITELKYKGQVVPFKNADDLFVTIFFDFKPKDEIELVTKRGTQTLKRTIILEGTTDSPDSK